MTNTIAFLLMIATIVCGCSSTPRRECENRLCGHAWALELDSAVAYGESRLQSEPNNENALLDLADAYRQKAWFIKNQTDMRADFWLRSNLNKIGHLLDEGLQLCDKVLQRKPDVVRAYQIKGKILAAKLGLIGPTSDQDKSATVRRESVSNLERAVALAPNSAELWYDLARACAQDWYTWRKAGECLKRAVELDPAFRPFAIQGWYYSRYREYRLRPGQVLSSDIAHRDPEVVRILAHAGSGYEKFDYLEAIRLVPNVAKAPLALGLFSLVSDYEETIARFYEKIVSTDHHLGKDHLDLAWCYYDRPNPDTAEAMKHFLIWAEATKGIGLSYDFTFFWGRRRAGISSFVTNAGPLSAMAWIYAGMEAPPGARLEFFKRAIALDSSSALPCYLVAATYSENNDWRNAELWLQETMRKAAGDEFIRLNAHLLAAVVAARTGNRAQLLHEARIALLTDSAYTAYSLSRGVYSQVEVGSPDYQYYRSGLWFLLDKPLGLASSIQPSDKKLASLLDLWSGWSHYLSKKFNKDKRYVSFFRKAIELDPDNIEAYDALASLYIDYELKDEEGIVFLQNVFRRYPNDGRAHRILGNLYLVRNMIDAAEAELQKAKKLGDSGAEHLLDALESTKAQRLEKISH